MKLGQRHHATCNKYITNEIVSSFLSVLKNLCHFEKQVSFTKDSDFLAITTP